ncbi:hypothetical protein F4861DRAFT_352381 [Xylaria intraflava]|nr:hypothetical protein F4861DRAFT_352381 [Xylaria intraflava]
MAASSVSVAVKRESPEPATLPPPPTGYKCSDDDDADSKRRLAALKIKNSGFKALLSLPLCADEYQDDDEYYEDIKAWFFHTWNENSEALLSMPLLEVSPKCGFCGAYSESAIVMWDNPNGNANRPYFKCSKCKRFLVFRDWRGIDPENPVCCCGYISRRGVTGVKNAKPGRLFYTCVAGDCDFFEWMTHDREVIRISMDPRNLENLASKFYI